MLQLLKSENFLQMPWANGLGSTQQIDIVPSSASLAAKDFYWRLSFATLQTSSSFSRFPGYQRWLVLVEGQSVFLNKELWGLFEAVAFDGTLPVECTLAGPPAKDLGVIYDDSMIDFNATQNIFSAGSEEMLSLHKDVHYLCALQGGFTAREAKASSELAIRAGDILKAENISALHLRIPAKQDCRLAVVSFGRKKI